MPHDDTIASPRLTRRRSQSHLKLTPPVSCQAPLRVPLPSSRDPLPVFPPALLAEFTRRQTRLWMQLLDGLTDYIFLKDALWMTTQTRL